jgi:hypothetical protein
MAFQAGECAAAIRDVVELAYASARGWSEYPGLAPRNVAG